VTSPEYQQLAPFLMEIGELIDSLLFRLEALERISEDWRRHREQAETEGNRNRWEFSQNAFTDAIGAQTREQGRFFDALEAFLAAWSRLSLIFFPARGGKDSALFRNARGNILRMLLDVGDDSPLGDRDLRNSWMHFDERLDERVLAGSWGNRHTFVLSTEAPRHMNATVRLMEIDTLRVHYRSQTGEQRSTSLRDLRPVLEQVFGALPLSQERYYEVYPPPTDDAAT
jgi:hypothetical protein